MPANNRLALAAAALALCCGPASASMITADYAWTGSGGWGASGTVVFDSTDPAPSVSGGLVSGIDSLSFEITDRDGDPYAAGWSVLSGVAQVDWLLATIDPVALVFTGDLQLGFGSPRQALVFLPSMADAWLVVDGGGRDFGNKSLTLTLREPDPTPIQAPAVNALLGLGLLALGVSRARRGRHAR